MEQVMAAETKNPLLDTLNTIESRILEQFSLMSKEIGYDFDDATAYFEGTRLSEAFKERMGELRTLVANGEINPDFVLNVNQSDDYFALDREVTVVLYPFAGNPPHWGHLISALDALIQSKADKVIFVSNGNDFRKPHLTDMDIRYAMIRDALALFEPFFVFGDIAKKNLPGESFPLIGEYTLFRFLSLNPMTKITAYYLAGSDHLHRTIVREGKAENDVIGFLEDNVADRLLGYDPEYHTVRALMIARNAKEYDRKIKDIVNPKVAIHRVDPTISFSSTQLRHALAGDGFPEALLLLPHLNYVKIRDNDWYRSLQQ